MIRGIDASMNCTPYSNNLRAMNVQFICRYYTNLERTRKPEKALTSREAHTLSDAGFSIVTVWELLASHGYFSFQQGEADGEYAYRYANEVIKQPEDTAIYFAVDFDATESQYVAEVLPYFQGVTQAFGALGQNRPIYSVGVYGSGAVCAALKGAGIARFSWLAQAARWQGTTIYADWDIRQGPLVSHPPFEFDENLAKDEFGAFRLPFELANVSFSVASMTETKVEKSAGIRARNRKKKAQGRQGAANRRG
jgi:hypothetical protein